MDNTILLALQSTTELLGWTILHSVWQITIIAIVLKLLLTWTSKYDATIRYALGISALFVATFWSIHTFSVALSEVNFSDSSVDTDRLGIDLTSTIISEVIHFSPSSYLNSIKIQSAQTMAPFLPFLAIFWFIGILFFASRILVGLFRLHHFSNHGIDLLPSVWSTRLLTLKQQIGIQRPIKVRLSNLVKSPITYQFFRPIILLPVSLFTHLSDEQIEVLLLHELAHIKRNDYVVNLIQSVIEVLFFYHPLIWWMSKQVRLEREHCCDDRVMNLRHNPMLYAQTLTQIQRQHYSLKTKLAMSATGNTRDFSKRIYRLFQQKEPYATLRNSVAALLLLLFSGSMMAFYPRQSSPIISSEATSTIVQDTLPKTITVETADYKNKKLPLIIIDDKEVIKAKSYEHLTELLKKHQQENVAAVMVMKDEQYTNSYEDLVGEEVIYIYTKNGPKKEARRGYKLHQNLLKKQKTKATKATLSGNEIEYPLQEIVETESKLSQTNAKKRESFNLKMKDGLLTLKMLKGKQPIVYLDNKVYHKWKINEEGTLVVDIPNDEVLTINVFKREKAIELFGPEASDEVVYIITKANPNPDVIIEKEKKLHLETSGKKPLVVIDGKVSTQVVEDIDPDNIKTINVIGGETAIKRYGNKGKDDVIEIYTKGNESKVVSDNKSITGKIEGNSFTLKSDNPDKKPLMVIDGQVSQKEMKDLDTDKIGMMSVLKGKAAHEKYGEAGKNGVVEVYTKGNEPVEEQKKATRKIKLDGEVGTTKTAEKKNEWIRKVEKINEVKPLFVIDGKKLPKGNNSETKLAEISPDEIAFISVLKDEKAIAKYGEEGINGVVEIITKANKKAIKEQKKVKQAKEKEKKELKREKKKSLKAKKQTLLSKQKEIEEKQQMIKAEQKAVLEMKQKEMKEKEKLLKAKKRELAEKAFQAAPTGLSVYPNPTRALTNVQLILKKKGQVKVDILNVKGQVVLSLVNEVMDKGVHHFQWNSDNQPAGSYFVHFNLDGSFISKQVVVKK